MRLVEVKIIYNANFGLSHYETDTGEYLVQFIGTMLKRPDVIHVSRTIIEGGDDDD